jgi:AGZA family xanthine/uracil permease-like MFS transporter
MTTLPRNTIGTEKAAAGSRRFLFWLDNRFQYSSRGSNFKTEIIAGIATFSTMSYVLVVNPLVMSGTGMDRGALITSTAIISALFCVVMGLWTNYPLAMAPGLGSIVYVSVQVCQTMHIPWQAALGLVFYAGVLFLLVSVTGLRQSIMNAFPSTFKKTISAGIGLFLAFVGLRSAGILVASPRSLVGLGHLSSPPALLALFGIVVVFILVARRVPGALIWAILLVTVIGLFVPVGPGQPHITEWPHPLISQPNSMAPIAFKLDLVWFWSHLGEGIPIVLALLFMDLFSAMAVLFAIGQRANLNDAEGNLPKLRQALEADSLAACGAAVLGSTTAIIYLESAAGVEQGGRTGLASLSAAGCFLLALVFTPIIFVIPSIATTPALVAIGAFMLQGLSDLDLREPLVASTVLITALLMALTSISDGMAIGFLINLAVLAFTGSVKAIKPMAWALAALFLFHFLT